MQSKTGKPVYRYLYSKVRPEYTGIPGGATPTPGPAARGAVHSAEIQYAMGNLGIDPRYKWTDDDRAVSKLMQGYFANFIKTGNPNGKGLPKWPKYEAKSAWQVVNINTRTGVEKETGRDRYLAIEAANKK